MNLSSPAAVAALLRRHSFQPAHKFGQNFLVDGNILAKIVAAGELAAGDSVIEIGTGLGVLTRALAEQVGPSGGVTTVERDARLAPLHDETLAADEFPQVRRIEGDALEIDLDELFAAKTSSARMTEYGNSEVDARLSARGIAVVANIPYNITSPLIARLLEHAEPFRVIVLLVQKEVGERLCARPGSSEYGAFTVFAQFYSTVEIVASVSPKVFFPPPKITSAIIRLRPRLSPAVDVGDRALFFMIVRAAFGQRRKTLLNALSSDATGWTRAQAQEVLDMGEIDGMRRGETLSLEDFAALERAARNVFAPESV